MRACVFQLIFQDMIDVATIPPPAVDPAAIALAAGVPHLPHTPFIIALRFHDLRFGLL
jgi:hypothetical protein